ncbi:MAG: hypothetical protein H7833_21260, partial [Magnetococcus sp. DMHC-1]
FLQLGNLYYSKLPVGSGRDLAKGFSWYQQGADQDEEAYARTEAMRLIGYGTDPDPVLALSRLQTAIQNGNMHAASLLGKFTLGGFGGPPVDYQRARACLIIGANGKSREAAFWVALVLAAGLGGPQDVQLATHYAGIVVNENTTLIHCLAGGLHLVGVDGFPDTEYALELLQKGATAPTTLYWFSVNPTNDHRG